MANQWLVMTLEKQGIYVVAFTIDVSNRHQAVSLAGLPNCSNYLGTPEWPY
jgi:hypothetical protein